MKKRKKGEKKEEEKTPPTIKKKNAAVLKDHVTIENIILWHEGRSIKNLKLYLAFVLGNDFTQKPLIQFCSLLKL